MMLATCILFRLMQQKEKYISGIPAHSVQSGQRTLAKGGPSKRWRFSIVWKNDGKTLEEKKGAKRAASKKGRSLQIR